MRDLSAVPPGANGGDRFVARSRWSKDVAVLQVAFEFEEIKMFLCRLSSSEA